MSNETESAEPLGLGLGDGLGMAVNRALFADECNRLNEWAQIGPVQRAALESFAERLLAAEMERCAKLCEDRAIHQNGPHVVTLEMNQMAEAIRGKHDFRA